MRLHVVGLPHCPLTREFYLDGFAQVTRRFARLLKELGHTVYLYGCEETDAPCDEFISCISWADAKALLDMDKDKDPNGVQYQHAWIDEGSPIYKMANPKMALEVAKRKKPRDFICLIGGASQRYVPDWNKDLLFVEWSIGYTGSYGPYRVFESVAWQHCTYGFQNITDGRFFDTVIPLFYDPDEFPFRAKKDPFALYVGRLTIRKGLEIACRAAEAAGVPLKVIGHGDPKLVTHGAEYLGALNDEERNDWMSRAQCVLTPTQYLEPFNQVAVEAQLTGSAVVATDWGGMTETIEDGKTGFRCHVLGDFVDAIHACKQLDPHYIRQRAVANYSIESAKPKYQAYFERLMLLWGKGWDTLHNVEPAQKIA